MKDFSFVSNIGDKIDNATKVMSEKPEGFFDFVSTNLGGVCIMVILVGALFLVVKMCFSKLKTSFPTRSRQKSPANPRMPLIPMAVQMCQVQTVLS